MKKIKLLMVYFERGNATTLSRHLALFDIDVQVVHTLQEGLDLESEFDLLMVDICFPIVGNESILEDNERIELFLETPYSVFNFLKKTTKPIFLFDTYPSGVVTEKLEHLKLLPRVVYKRAPLLMKEDILPLIYSITKQNST